MNIHISKEIEKKLIENSITVEIASFEQLDEIYELYNRRTVWFKENNIKQWSKYLIRHKSEFPILIEDKKYYILKKNNEIIAGFELSNDSGNFIDNKKSLYLSKIVTKVGYKDIGKIIFMICKEIAKMDNKIYLRLECVKWNQKLNEIYEKHGFKLVGCGTSYYEYNLRECNIYE